MPHGMPGRIEEVERPIAKIVKSVESPNLETRVKGYLKHLTPFDICVENYGVFAGRPAWPSCGANFGTDYQRRGFGKLSHIADVVEVIVRPYDCRDVASAYIDLAAVSSLVQHGGYVSPWCYNRGYRYQSNGLRGIVAPVRPRTQVKEHMLAGSVVGDQEAVYGRVRFDYVIVGGGTAGLVLASRLTENRHITVAVIEAGTSPEAVAGNLTVVPGYAGALFGEATQLNLDWGFQVTPQKSLLNRTASYLRGKALGGSSNLNFMSYGQSSKGSHKKWAELVSDQSYTYENMLQYYRKAMKFTEPQAGARSANATAWIAAADAAASGTLPVTFGATWVALGLEAIGIHQVSAFVNGNNLGWAWNLYTIKSPKATRATSETAYLRPVLRHKEVILSAGVFQSPHLLLVSGVGPKAVLEQYNISLIADRPGVGQKMYDQNSISVMYQVDLVTNTRLSQDPDYAAEVLEEYKHNRTGPLSSPGGDLFGQEKIPKEFRAGFSDDTKAYKLPADWPEIGYVVYPNGASVLQKGANYAIMQALLMAPRSTGSVTIKSADMAVAPVINPDWFSSQTDVEVMVAGLKRVRQALSSSAMAPIIIGDELLPGQSVKTEEDMALYVAQRGSTLYHAMASNKMGKTSDPDAVVDNRGRVIGVKKYVLAEKLADDIKNTVY
ncbi:putative alcohol dehydrogenase [Glarea lozoyensis 74030]|uniref:Putative alcohol dehydrogenase n=1 Tax=Glarea lozoyensis (strain ATCC 74030 / MF5533) TaxID=1104152 RepID=H0EI53_GLAL7|nr:putative alcohol dehydrogenase [Glarea lozoyensis 74030]